MTVLTKKNRFERRRERILSQMLRSNRLFSLSASRVSVTRQIRNYFLPRPPSRPKIEGKTKEAEQKCSEVNRSVYQSVTAALQSINAKYLNVNRYNNGDANMRNEWRKQN